MSEVEVIAEVGSIEAVGSLAAPHEGGAQHGRQQASVARFDVAELSLFCVRLRPRWLPGGAGKHGAKKPNGR